MADPQRAHEPTMEEILASIRRIISDDEAGAEAAPESEEAPSEDVEMQGDEAENTNEDVDALFADAADEMAAEAEETAMADAEAEAEDEAEPQPEPEPEDGDGVFELTEEMAAEADEEDEASDDDIDALMADFDSADDEEPAAAAAAADDDEHESDIAFRDPVVEEEPVAEAPAPAPATEGDAIMSPDSQAAVSAAFGALASSMLSHSGGARTLEQIVEDLLRPLLKVWLDENLPPLVERLVREEIDRVARHAR